MPKRLRCDRPAPIFFSVAAGQLMVQNHQRGQTGFSPAREFDRYTRVFVTLGTAEEVQGDSHFGMLVTTATYGEVVLMQGRDPRYCQALGRRGKWREAVPAMPWVRRFVSTDSTADPTPAEKTEGS